MVAATPTFIDAGSSHMRMYLSISLSFCIDFGGELSGSHLVTRGLQLGQAAGESEEDIASYT